MRIHICAVGRLRSGPNLFLYEDYQKRFNQNGKLLGFKAINLIEIEAKNKSDKEVEAKLLNSAIPKSATLIGLDESGEQLSSIEFASFLKNMRDQNQSDLGFVIGGADGLTPEFKKSCKKLVSFGRMVWPHMLVRIMLSEQLYRASTILLNGPYHRV